MCVLSVSGSRTERFKDYYVVLTVLQVTFSEMPWFLRSAVSKQKGGITSGYSFLALH